jgi:hypothetical protein
MPARRSVFRGLVAVIVGSALVAACGSSGSKSSATTPTSKSTGSGATGPTGTKAVSAATVHKRVGKVTTVGAGTITIVVRRLGTLQLHTTSTTKFERAGAGSTTAVKVGDRVLVVQGHDVLVLPHGSAIGRLVGHVSKHTVAIAKGTGKRAATIALTKTTVIETTSPAALSDVKADSQVLAVVRGKGKGATDTIEVIVLPPGSPFAT